MFDNRALVVAGIVIIVLVMPVIAHAQTVGDPGAGLQQFVTYLQSNVAKSVGTAALWVIGAALCFAHHSLIGTVCVVAGCCIMFGAGGVATLF